MTYIPSEAQYATMRYRHCGRWGLRLPEISLGLWQNFGDADPYERGEAIVLRAFDRGVTCFDLANNYGPAPGSAESNFGRTVRDNLRPYRDRIVVTTKAGYTMWDGPYGDWGSRKYLIASCDQSLRRMGLDYVDIFYSHRHDPKTPLEETMTALDHIVRSGRALYAALSNYPEAQFNRAVEILASLGTPCIAHQIKYSMLVRERGNELFASHRRHGVGCVSFSPLAQGLLSDKYLNGIPEGSRASRNGSLSVDYVTANIDRVRALNAVAEERGQTLAQMAIAWQLYDNRVTSVLVGVSSERQLDDNLAALSNCRFSDDELRRINKILK
jgi:L-glyceraldehyde 3-phosphate reductase